MSGAEGTNLRGSARPTAAKAHFLELIPPCPTPTPCPPLSTPLEISFLPALLPGCRHRPRHASRGRRPFPAPGGTAGPPRGAPGQPQLRSALRLLFFPSFLRKQAPQKREKKKKKRWRVLSLQRGSPGSESGWKRAPPLPGEAQAGSFRGKPVPGPGSTARPGPRMRSPALRIAPGVSLPLLRSS